MKKIFSSAKLYVAPSKNLVGERGVFTRHTINIGETIELCPIIEIPSFETESLENSILTTYLYFFGRDKEKMLLALGFGSIYNHSSSPNAKYKINSKEKIIEFISLKKITKDEEIMVNYLQGNSTKLPLWFEA